MEEFEEECKDEREDGMYILPTILRKIIKSKIFVEDNNDFLIGFEPNFTNNHNNFCNIIKEINETLYYRCLNKKIISFSILRDLKHVMGRTDDAWCLQIQNNRENIIKY